MQPLLTRPSSASRGCAGGATEGTVGGSPLTLSYATAPAGGSQQHTGTQLRVAGHGPQAAKMVGLTDQTDLFFTISRALRLDRR